MKIRTTKKQLAKPTAEPPRVEICRSFAYKLNIPGAYESRDFFCSAKTECAKDDMVDTAAAMFMFCRGTVLNDVRQYKADAQAQRAKGE